MEQSLGINPEDVIKCSGKTGVGVPELIEAIIERIPAPGGGPNGPLQAMVFDSAESV
jgi:GTP-binding protein LepA